jgi:hypothetical protein
MRRMGADYTLSADPAIGIWLDDSPGLDASKRDLRDQALFEAAWVEGRGVNQAATVAKPPTIFRK